MLSLSPVKLLVILVIALIVLGPEKLPQVARQIGAAWHDLRQWRSRIESEVRGTFPNLPPTHEVAQAVRSPLAFLDRLADEHERASTDESTQAPETTAEPAGTVGTDGIGPSPPSTGPAASTNGTAVGNGTVASNGTASHNGVSGGAPPSSGAADVPAERAGTVVPGVYPAVPDDPNMN